MEKINRNIKNNWILYKLAFLIGLTGYGGIAVVNQIRQEYVKKHKIIDEKKFLDSLGLAQVLPGSTIISLISYFSYLKAGLIGGIMGTAIYILPSFTLISLLSHIYFNYKNLLFIQKIVGGLNVLLISLLSAAFINIGKSIFIRNEKTDGISVLISIVCASLYYFTDLSIIYIILIAGLGGIFLYYLTGIITNKTTGLENNKKFIVHKKAWLAFISLVVVFSIFIYYTSDVLWILYTAFLKIGALAFGGGITAIPLIKNVIVTNQQWFTEKQFWDGMSITQITPGPIFISSAFFGYHVAGIIGAFIAVTAICIPSFFLMIIFGKIHDRMKQLAIVRSAMRGLLAGFMGILIVLIVNQSQRVLLSWKEILLLTVTFLIITNFKKGLIYTLLFTLIYSLILW